MKKVLWQDTETTHTDPIRGGIIQLAGLIEIDGNIVEEFDFKCAPYATDEIVQEALDVNGFKLEEIKSFPSPMEVKNNFVNILGHHCNKFDRNDKFFPAGYNARFDVDFLASWFKKAGDKYLGSWINWRILDPLSILYILHYQGKIDLPNYKLETVAAHFGVTLSKAHDALSDVRAARDVFKIVEKEFFHNAGK